MFIPIIGPWIVYGIIGIFSILIGKHLQGVLVIIVGWIIETSTDFYIRPRIAVQYSEIPSTGLFIRVYLRCDDNGPSWIVYWAINIGNHL